MKVQVVSFVKCITVAWPLISLFAPVVFFAVFLRPLRQILERFNCKEVESIEIGPIKIRKQARLNHRCLRRPCRIKKK